MSYSVLLRARSMIAIKVTIIIGMWLVFGRSLSGPFRTLPSLPMARQSRGTPTNAVTITIASRSHPCAKRRKASG